MFSVKEISEKLQEYFNNDTYDQAIALLNLVRAKEEDPEILNYASHHLGRIYLFSDDYDKAKECFAEAVKYKSNDHYSIVFLAKICMINNHSFSSMKLFERAYRLDESQKQILYSIKKLVENIPNDDSEIEKLLNDFAFDPKKSYSSERISIIVLCYNKVEFTEICLRSIFKNTLYENYEVIVVDNASVDNTPGLLESYGDTIKFVHLNKNLGFVGGNNAAAQYAEGEYIVFLNNDTEVQPNWLDNLHSVFKYYPDAGAVGSMLVYPNGKLQEAGGAIFNNMNGWNYGKNGDPTDSKFNFVREVDYCSGASLMVKKEIFNQLGGFDERFAPAYCEDTDFCFNIRKLGYKVYYSPFSKVVHFEGATAGTDLEKGFKKYQVVNAKKFSEKWEDELKHQYPEDSEQYYFFTNRKKGKRVLIIDDIPPLPDRAAGALRHYHTLTQMLELGYQVTYVHLMGSQYTDKAAAKYINHFKMRGVEFIWFNYESWWEIRDTPQVKLILKRLIQSLELSKRKFDLAYIAFWHIANYFVDLIKEEVPHLPILCDTMDIHYLRELRQAEMSGKSDLRKKAEENKKKEIALYSKVDCVTTVTENDRDELRKHLPNKSIVILTDVHDPVDTKINFEDREGFLFIGNFNHNPNEDAVIYFNDIILPIIRRKLPGVKFYIVGNNPTEKVKNLASRDVVVTGWVPEVLPYLKSCRVSVVPLRFGAGNKGKVGETMSHGLPMVSTTIGAEGMSIENGIHAFVADDPIQFAGHAVQLYTDKELWKQFSTKGRDLISNQYSSTLMKKRLEYILGFSSVAAFRGKLAINYPNPPIVSIVLITYNQIQFSKQCIESILAYTKISYEIIVVDNASIDDTVNLISHNYPEIKLIKNDKNLGFPIAVNQGINKALGDYVLILNNDTIVADGWLERMIEVAESENNIGMVGPISNEVSGLQKDNEANYRSIKEMPLYAERVSVKNKGEVFHFPRIAFLCTLIKKEVIEKIGGLDERYSPGNFEDDDYCLRTQLAGYKTVIAKDVFIHHFGSKSFKADGENKYAERLEINKKVFVDKWGATPEEIWLHNKLIKPRQTYYPINMNLFKQYFERAKVNIADNELVLAKQSIAKAVEMYAEGDGIVIKYDELLDLAGNIYLADKDIEKAKEYFERELQINVHSSTACFGLGQVFYATEQLESAKAMFEWGVKNNPENRIAIESLGKVNLLLGLDEAHNSLIEV